MRILVTNDDGIRAPGLRALAEALAPLGEVTVVAPEREQSCAGHAITLHKPLRMNPARLEGVAKAFSVSGTPADCVVLARFEEEGPPDLVVSGINAGANLGEEVFYSGTVAAAMEGCLQNLRSIAISVTAYHDCDFRGAAQFIARLAPAYVTAQMPEGMLLNVNVPNVAPEKIRGVRVTRLGRRAYHNVVHRRLDPRGRPYYWLGGEATEVDSGDGTDIGAIRANCISVTPVRFDVTDYDARDAVGEMLNQAGIATP
jgi:5'-nucleotidase